jgi:hypothetical protein
MADDENSKNILSKVITAVLIAVIAGGSSPWWWNKIFPSDDKKNVVTPSPQSSLQGKIVLIHISAESQRNGAEYLLSKLNENGAKVYRVTNLVKEGNVPSNNQKNGGKVFSEDGKILVKFFYNEDGDAAKEIKKLIAQGNIILDDNTQASKKGKQGTIEVWYPWSKQ